MSTEKKIYLADVPTGRTMAELESDETAAELDQELAKRLGITVEELNRPSTAEELAAMESDPKLAGMRLRMMSAAREVGRRYRAKRDADA